VAREVAKFTPARCTPGVLLSFRSIRLAHAAQVIPVMGKSTRSPAPSGVVRVCRALT
jgi:hypothetical protein